MGADLFAIRVGSLVIVDSEPTTEDPERGVLIRREATRLIGSSPIVTVEPKGGLEGQVHQSRMRLSPLEDATERTAVHFGGAISFRCHWPRKNQEFALYPSYAGPCAEDFAVAYNGFLYAVGVRCEAPLPRPYSFIFGREGWRLLEAILSPSDLWELDIIGPCPMFPVIYLAFADDPASFSLGRDLMREGDTLESLYVLPRGEIPNVEEALGDILESLLDVAASHYLCLQNRLEFMYEQGAVYRRLDEATRACCELAPQLAWTPRAWLRALLSQRKLRRLVAECYSHYVELEEARAGVSSLAMEAKEDFRRHPLLQPHEGYTGEVVRDVFEWHGQHVLEALRFVAEESRSRGLEAATWQGPLVAAAIAFAVTVVTLWLAG